MKTRSSRNSRNQDHDSNEPIDTRVRARFDIDALQGNYRAIHELAGGQGVLPMVKANAYGHGVGWAARALVGLPGLAGFGVATLEEGAELRRELTLRNRKTRIVVFSGAGPWSEEKGQFCEDNGLTPVLATEDDWNRFFKQGWPERIPYELKFNTGMNRLGMPVSIARQVASRLKDKPAEWHPQGVLTHLAMGEQPRNRVSQQQRERFAAVRTEFASICPAAQFHLANSSAIWARKEWGLDGFTDLVRPGLSLYGVPPWEGAPERGIRPVMTLEAQVIATHRLKAGDAVGYGATYVVSGNEPVYVAVLGAGYADGLSRSLRGTGGNTGGHAWLGGRAERFVGIVSMDMSAISATASVKAGDWAQILGPNVDPWAQAQAIGTIPYELLTSVSRRVQRSYE